MAKKPLAMVARPDLDVPANDEDLLQLTNDGNAVATFFRGLAAWFGTQRQWEKKAEARLMGARTLMAPYDQASDELVQKFVLGTTAMEKDYEEHSSVKGLLWKLHKRAVSIHNRAAKPLEDAKTHATNLHNRYAEAERKRVAEENAKRQREADEKARKEREAELAKLEEAALRAEAGSDKLSEREQAFVEGYYAGRARGNATEAARMAGFKDPFASGARLLASDKVRKTLDGKRLAESIREQQKAVEQAPLDVTPIEEAVSNVGRAATDVTRRGAELLDADLLMQAVFDNKLGIPRDVLMVNEVKLNQYGRDLGDIVNRWPGVRATKKTSGR